MPVRRTLRSATAGLHEFDAAHETP
jgi:hypothetical protein